MPLKGNLAVFTTTQLLNLINLSKKTGKLSLHEPIPTGDKLTMGDGQTKIDKFDAGKELASLYFKDGILIYAEMAGKDGHLAGILQRAGKLNEEQARQIREKLGSLNDRALALRLINANYVTKNDIMQSIQKHTVSIVFDLMAWKKEPFEFRESETTPQDRILVPIDLKNVIIEGTRIHQQQKQLEDELPDLDLALKLPDDPNERFRKVQLSTDEWRVVGFINPKNTIRQIAKACNMTDTEIRRIVYALLQAGLVQLVKPQKPEQPKKPTSTFSSKSETIKANAPSRAVVSRLIDKIKSI